MWIIPKNSPIYPYAQDMEGLISDSQELSELCAQSLMWRSKPSQSSTWLKRLKRVSWIQPLSLQTLKSSLGDSIVEKWTSSLEASLVSHLARPDEEPEMKTLDTYGPSSSKGLESWEDLPLFSLRTSKALSQASSREMVGEIPRVRLFCSMSSESWRDWVTKQRRGYSQRLKSAHRTKEKECLFLVSEMISSKAVMISSEPCSIKEPWLTPAATAGTAKEPLFTKTGETWSGEGRAYRMSGLHRTLTLQMQVDCLQPTPRREALSNTSGNLQGSQWGTPTTRDWKDIKLNQETKPKKDGKRRINMMTQQIHIETGYKGKLNPRWVETLMGLPIGWTMPSCQNPVIVELTNSECLEMELCPTQQAEHSRLCLQG